MLSQKIKKVKAVTHLVHHLALFALLILFCYSIFSYSFTKLFLSNSFIVLVKIIRKAIPVTVTAMPSAIGSANNTPSTSLLHIKGRKKIKGINRRIYLSTARNNDTLALPIATKVC